MKTAETVIAALAPSIAKFIELAKADSYDQEAEYQAILKMQRDLADLRAKRILDGK